MLQLELDQSSERRIVEGASKLGLTPERYAILLLQEAMIARAEPPQVSSSLTSGDAVDEWERALDRLIEEQDHSIPPIPDEALRREGLYEDRS